MSKVKVNKPMGIELAFRVFTPALLAILGTLMLAGQGDLKTDLDGLKLHFVNHLMHHQDLEVGYERRITKIEESRFTSENGDALENKFDHQLELYRLDHSKNYPPKWLTDKVNEIERKTEVILEKIEKTRR